MEKFFQLRAENFGPLEATVFRRRECWPSIEAASKSGHPMSAITPKADVNGYGAGGPLLTPNGHLLPSNPQQSENEQQRFMLFRAYLPGRA